MATRKKSESRSSRDEVLELLNVRVHPTVIERLNAVAEKAGFGARRSDMHRACLLYGLAAAEKNIDLVRKAGS